MARFEHLLHALDPYGTESNVVRADRVKSGRPRAFDPSGEPGLSVIVLNKDRPDLLEALWDVWPGIVSIFESHGVDVELLVGDTGSTDDAACRLLEHPPLRSRVWRDLEYQFSRCNNDLFDEAAYDTVLFMNNDVLLGDRPDALWDAYHLVASDVSIGALGAVLYFADGRVQHAGIDFFERSDLFGFCYHPGAGGSISLARGAVFDAPATTGAFLMTRARAFAQVGGFDERYAAECQDVDLCLRLDRVGLGTKVAHLGGLLHLENGTRQPGDENWDDRALFTRRWNSYVEARR